MSSASHYGATPKYLTVKLGDIATVNQWKKWRYYVNFQQVIDSNFTCYIMRYKKFYVSTFFYVSVATDERR